MLGPLPRNEVGNKNAVLLADSYSKVSKVCLTAKTTAKRIANIFTEHLVASFGILSTVLTGNEQKFTSKLFAGFREGTRRRSGNNDWIEPSDHWTAQTFQRDHNIKPRSLCCKTSKGLWHVSVFADVRVQYTSPSNHGTSHIQSADYPFSAWSYCCSIFNTVRCQRGRFISRLMTTSHPQSDHSKNDGHHEVQEGAGTI